MTSAAPPGAAAPASEAGGPAAAAGPLSGSGPGPGPPQAPAVAPALSVSCRMLRSPSHESVTTDLSLLSVSSMSLAQSLAQSDARQAASGLRLGAFNKRGVSPNPDSLGQVSIARPPDIPELLWFEEENELIRSCAALSSALGLQRSFSTSDIAQLGEEALGPGGMGGGPGMGLGGMGLGLGLQGLHGALGSSGGGAGQGGAEGDSPPMSARPSVSEPALNSLQRLGFIMEQHQLNRTSRSCSTWVAVGDVVSTSQLPSPHGGHSLAPPAAPALTPGPPAPPAPTPATPSFTPADLIRSVNKKVRQNYIRRRLLMTYKALERLSQSEFNLDRLEAAASASSAALSGASPSPVPGTGPGSSASQSRGGSVSGAAAGGAPALLTVPGGPAPARLSGTLSPTSTVLRVVKQRQVPGGAGEAAHGHSAAHASLRAFPLTVRDVERSQGRPLSRYDRNMMIFNWLHTLDDSDFEKLEVA